MQIDRTVKRTVPLRAPCVCLNICHKNYGMLQGLQLTATVRHRLIKDVGAATSNFLSPYILLKIRLVRPPWQMCTAYWYLSKIVEIL